MSAELEGRIGCLGGLRGALTIMVVASHYFAETQGGTNALALGWVAVDLFFVLSGFLVGRLIIDKGSASNFLPVFYARRLLRTLPIYAVCVVLSLMGFAFVDAAWTEMDRLLDPVAYATFTQNFAMAQEARIGPHWLAPTWTLAVEEQFYLIAPAIMLVLTGRTRIAVLAIVALASVLFRWGEVAAGRDGISYLTLPWARADALALGLLTACIARNHASFALAQASRLMAAVPTMFVGVIVAVLLLEDMGLAVFGHALVSLAGLALLLAISNGVPEARRLDGPLLRWFGHHSYAIYLTHMPVLFLAHGLTAGRTPTIADPVGMITTVSALPVVALLAVILTRLVEEPLTALGRRLRWRLPEAAPAAGAASRA